MACRRLGTIVSTMTKPSNNSLSVGICSQSINRKSGEIQLFPAGPFRAQDGRPTDAPHWFITESTVSRINASSRVNRFIIDYEHQTLLSKTNGNAAPKAGDFRHLVFRDDGVFADDVAWTSRAADYIESDEYSHISPVFVYNKSTGEILDITMAAITNDPAIDGMNEAVVHAAASLGFNHSILKPQSTESEMDEDLLAALGLEKDATAEQAVAAATALKAKAKENESALATATSELATLKNEKPDPEKFAPVAVVTELQTQVAALSKQVQSSEIDDLIEPAMSDGRLLPSLEDWARELGNKDIAALTSFLGKTTPVAGLGGNQTEGKAPEGDGKTPLSESETSIAAACGITTEQFTAAKKPEAA